jgi:hypothetical protein
MKHCIVFLTVALISGCVPDIVIKSTFDVCTENEALIAVEPIKPGLFIEEQLLKDLDSSLEVYVQSKCSAAQVFSTKSEQKKKFTIKLKYKGKDSLQFSIPDTVLKDGKVASCIVMVTNLQVSSKSKQFGIPVGAIPTPIGFFVVSVKTDPVPISLDYSYDFAIWNYVTKSVLRYGTIKDQIPIYKINETQYSLKENTRLFFRGLLNE